MPAHKKYDAVATIGTYQSGGEEKKRYLNVGAVFENEKGQLSMKLDALPTSPEWSGWISFFEPKERGGRDVPASQVQYRSQPQARAAGPKDYDVDGDSVPF